MIYDTNSKPWIPLIDFLAKHDENEIIDVRLLVEGKLEDGTEVFVQLPDDFMENVLNSFAGRLKLPNV